ncbi:MAG: biopolymer transporter ExbD [Bacteroidetes bacterium]|jgi:biopolymer transport protein ExbD|nr:biopolymer transporter ExbD [Flavobacteriales bacterium]NCF57682.1 biopolymer transporter ExbD [Bacteroidota bacterium]NCG14322.1 biopolymer transporter ExbD [Bacteroidota bacterium]NCG44647.1 biopolymer transporter ExbD [Pseudomonadota bacterium]
MSKFSSKKPKEIPAVNTASLPDIVFMLLFFFMVTTTMRDLEMLVGVLKPKATEIQKIERKDLTTYIYVGTPNNTESYGSEPRVQLDDQLGLVSDVQAFVILKREEINEKERPKFMVSIKADVNVKMGLISDIKQELRKAQALKVMYSSSPASSAEDLYRSM